MITVGRDEVETVARSANIFTMRKCKVTRIKAIQSKSEALEAAGLRESARARFLRAS